MSDFSKENNETAQRAELHRKIWAIADDVRGAVDGWDFKQYVLGMLFYKLCQNTHGTRLNSLTC